MICDTTDKNAVRISDYVKGGEEQEQRKGKAEGKREWQRAFKYSNEGKGRELYILQKTVFQH